jgi:ABC-type arginine transport system ATPase subunit
VTRPTTGVTTSGFYAPLSLADTQTVTSKGGNVIERVGGFTYLYDGLVFGGEEFRIMLGRDWFQNLIAARIHSYQMQTPLAAFDEETVSVIGSIIQEVGQTAIGRRILTDTVERPFVVTMPDPDTFDAIQRRSHVMAVSEAFSGYLNSSVTDYRIVGVWAQ